jgi:hypothetical protein
MNDPKPKPVAEPAAAADDANQDPAGDFTLSELLRAHARNYDHEGRPISRQEGDE